MEPIIKNFNIDIAGNIKAVEGLKAELIQNIADIYKQVISEPDGAASSKISEYAAGAIVNLYLLSKRLGVSFENVSDKVSENILLNIKENHILEKKFGDLSELLKVLGGRE